MTQPSTEKELENAITEAYAEQESCHTIAARYEELADGWEERAWLLENELRILRGGQ